MCFRVYAVCGTNVLDKRLLIFYEFPSSYFKLLVHAVFVRAIYLVLFKIVISLNLFMDYQSRELIRKTKFVKFD